MQWVTAAVALGLLAGVSACAQPSHHEVTPAYRDVAPLHFHDRPSLHRHRDQAAAMVVATAKRVALEGRPRAGTRLGLADTSVPWGRAALGRPGLAVGFQPPA